MRVLVLNAGSSSLKASVIESSSDATLAESTATWDPVDSAAGRRAQTVSSTLAELIRAAEGAIGAVGHRVVHGGTAFHGPTVVDDGVLQQIEALDELAPLHNRIAADTIQAARRLLPDIVHVACFDTSFHATLEEAAWRYPVPRDWHSRWGIRRFGFHGLSVAWAVERAAALLQRPISRLNLVVAHLGSGSSVTAVAADRSVDTSMGLTPLEGLMMGTRAGSIDPGVLLYLLRAGVEADDLADALEHRSGLLGVSGTTADVVELERAAAAGDGLAEMALAIYARRAAAGMAAAATTLDRLDALVFTGGIGEHSAFVRGAICERLSVLGVDAWGSAADDVDAVISGPDASVAVIRVTAREDVVIARQAAELLARPHA
jgi:acetate kinase